MVVEVRDIIGATWAQSVTSAILEAAKAEVGIARIHYSKKEIMRPGTEQPDRIEVTLTIKAP